MLNGLFKLYDIGKELGLSKKEINSVFLVNYNRQSLLYGIVLIIIASFVGVMIFLFLIEAAKNIYPANALYSTVKVKDFKTRTNK